MNTTAPTLHEGMEVYTQDGERLGSIGAIWPHVPVSSKGGARAPWDLSHSESDPGYFRVDGEGVLSIGAKHWFVPMRDIATVGPGDRLTLARTQAESEDRYTQRPSFIQVDII